MMEGQGLANLRVALVGCGKIGQKHLQALVHTKSIELIATMDMEPEKAAAAAVAFDAAHYSDVDTLFRSHPELDAVIVATPSGTHRRLVEAALDSHLHVLVEKPIALSSADAHAMVALARQRNRILAVTQFNRLLPTVTLALETFHEGRLGRLVEGGISVRWSRPQSYYDADPWRGSKAMDGGVLFNQAIHALDLLLQFAGPIQEVFAFAGTLTHEMECEDTVAGVLKAANGALLTVNATTSVAEANLEERITVVGSHGSLVLGPTVQEVEFWRVPDEDEDEIRQEVREAPARAGWQSHADALLDFEAAITNGRATRLAGDSTCAVIEVIEALLRSAETGQRIMLSQALRSTEA